MGRGYNPGPRLYFRRFILRLSVGRNPRMNPMQPISPQSREISVANPISPALERVKAMLFQPFDLGRWFVIGFCAWLAFLGESGGGGLNFHFPGGGGGHGKGLREGFEQARSFVLDNLYWIVPVAIGVLITAIVWGLVVTWLSSRGKFMFLHCVARNTAEVAQPWTKYSRVGNSLFCFRVVLGLIGLMVCAPVVALAVVLLVGMCSSHNWNGPGILGLIGLGLGLILIAVVFAIIRKLTMDFVVPIMFLRGKKCLDAWREFRELAVPNFGHFLLYLLFQIVLSMVIGMLVLAFVVVTCCFCCLLLLPYIGTVVMLPVLVFERAYPLYYLAQYGPAYDVFAVYEPPTPPASAAAAA